VLTSKNFGCCRVGFDWGLPGRIEVPSFCVLSYRFYKSMCFDIVLVDTHVKSVYILKWSCN
jgi:hypothetical protein